MNLLRLVFLCCGAMVGFIALNAFHFHKLSSVESRHRLVDIYKSVNLNDSDTVVAKKIITRVLTEKISTGRDNHTVKWYVSSPGVSMPLDWVLVLCFNNGYLEGASFDTLDNNNISPANSPPPKGKYCY